MGDRPTLLAHQRPLVALDVESDHHVASSQGGELTHHLELRAAQQRHRIAGDTEMLGEVRRAAGRLGAAEHEHLPARIAEERNRPFCCSGVQATERLDDVATFDPQHRSGERFLRRSSHSHRSGVEPSGELGADDVAELGEATEPHCLGQADDRRGAHRGTGRHGGDGAEGDGLRILEDEISDPPQRGREIGLSHPGGHRVGGSLGRSDARDDTRCTVRYED